MSVGGAVAIWHDIAPDGLDEFYAWHGEEHMPERVGISGFLRGRRFIAVDADPRHFNMYETMGPEVVAGPDYKARLNRPTPRTLSAVKHFRNVSRSLCRVEARFCAAESGSAQGGLVATLRYDVDAAREAADVATLRDRILPALARAAGVAGAMLLVADRDASGYVNAEQRARGGENAVPPVVAIVDGWADCERFMATVRAALSAAALRKAGLDGAAQLGFYRHELTVAKAARLPRDASQ